MFIRIFRQYAAIIRETAINQLRGEDKIANVGADIVAANLHAQRVSPPSSIRISSITPLRGTITEWFGSDASSGIEHTAAVTIGGHRAQFAAFGFKQHAV